MFTNSQLETLVGILERRQDPQVTNEEYTDMLRMAQSELNVRRANAERSTEARRSAVESPVVPDPFNDPIKW